MTRPLILRPEAEAEISEAYRWYEEQSRGLGAEFIRAVDACLSSIERQPNLYPEVYKQARRALIRRFPYGVYYVILSASIDVAACFHLRRDSRGWRSRL